MQKIYVIDASGWLYRSYFAIQNITNVKGESTNALFGFIRSVKKLIKDFKPDYLVTVFDGPRGIESRKKLYEGYKAKRAKMPDDLRYQIKWAREFCKLFGISTLNIEGVEADDTMGSIAKLFANPKTEVYLCTSDKDMAQLVTSHVKLLNTHKNNLILDTAGVEKTYGVPPTKIIDYLAIVGDASDNVPGLPGFGAKTAISLLQNIESIDELLENPGVVSGKKKQEAVQENQEIAKISKELVTIKCDVTIPQDLEFYRITEPRVEELKQFYLEKNFNSFLKELDENNGKKERDLELVESENEQKELLKQLNQEKEICFEVADDEILFAVSEERGWRMPIKKERLEEIKALFAQEKIKFFGHDVKKSCRLLAPLGISISTLSFDTVIASYLLNSHLRQHTQDQLSLIYFGKEKSSITTTFQLKKVLEKELNERGLTKLFDEMEMPLLPILLKMELDGIFLDQKILEKMSSDIKKEIKTLEEEIFFLSGENFNINSPKQLGHVLFEKLGIPAPKKMSTRADLLEELQGRYPIVEKVLEYRSLEKLRSTYIDTLPNEISKEDGRIHCTFNQFVAATGRLSCQNPNLQNIPVRTSLGLKVRSAFRPEKKGWKFLAADYSQIELRLLAHMSDDENLIQAFKNQEDIHTSTAASIFHTTPDKVTKLMRHQAKAVNFGIVYGQKAFGLSRELGVSVNEAQNFIDVYFKRYPRVLDFVASCKESARESGMAKTIVGRERKIPEINSSNGQLRSLAERLAINTPLQGSAADLIKIAMIKIDEKIAKEERNGYMVLQVHDELIFEIPEGEIEFFKETVKREMEGVFNLKVPLIVDIAVGNNWMEC